MESEVIFLEDLLDDLTDHGFSFNPAAQKIKARLEQLGSSSNFENSEKAGLPEKLVCVCCGKPSSSMIVVCETCEDTIIGGGF